MRIDVSLIIPNIKSNSLFRETIDLILVKLFVFSYEVIIDGKLSDDSTLFLESLAKPYLVSTLC